MQLKFYNNRLHYIGTLGFSFLYSYLVSFLIMVAYIDDYIKYCFESNEVTRLVCNDFVLNITAFVGSDYK
jgi:hypothetical protein